MNNSTQKTIAYKNFHIESLPWKLRENKGWKPHVMLRAHRPSETKTRPLEYNRTFATKEEAIQYGIEATKASIDKGEANNL